MSFPEQPFGFVAGRWVRSIGDTPDDADRAPDYVPVETGTVVFTPQVTHRVASDGTGWAGIIKERIPARLGERGQLIDAEGHDHLALAAGIYSVSYDFGSGRSWPSHYIEVKTTHTAEAPLWLPPIAPPPEGPMIENRVISIPADGEDGQVLVWDGAGFSWADSNITEQLVEARQLRDEQVAIAGLTGEDSAVAHLVGQTTSDTRQALATHFVTGTVQTAGGTTTPGHNIIIGPEAQAPTNIGTSGIVGGGAVLYENVIGGIIANVNTGSSNIPTGGAGTGDGSLTAPSGNWNWIWGGYDNVINGWACQVHGYHVAIEAGANHATISGGSLHTILADASYGTIAGGTGHSLTAGSSGATISGGRQNTASEQDSTIAGGQQNKATANSSTVGGGLQNQATEQSATIAGGFQNTATGNSATVSGGLYNKATETGAIVTGGRDNTASGQYSRAGGRGAVASNAGEDVFASGAFTTPGDAQATRIVLKRQTTDATPSDLQNPVALPPIISENTSWVFRALVVARSTTGDSAAWQVTGLASRGAGSTTALVGTPTVTQIGASAGATEWTVEVGSYTVGHLRLIGTGATGATIRWVASLDATVVKTI